jgi:peptide deformylase
MTSTSSLPPYIDINDDKAKNKEVLRTPAQKVTFPLDEHTQDIVNILEAKFDQEENCAGLAAPQIGYGLSIIVFAVEADEELKKFRADLTDTMPQSIWINPSWKSLTPEKTTDWEACFSAPGYVGRVSRFTEIVYEAWTPEGEKIEGTARGFLARLIQHEVDHLNGKLYIDDVPEGELLTVEDFKKLREEETA